MSEMIERVASIRASVPVEGQTATVSVMPVDFRHCKVICRPTSGPVRNLFAQTIDVVVTLGYDHRPKSHGSYRTMIDEALK